MIDAIIAFSIRNKLTVGLLLLAWVVWGTFSLIRLPLDAVPDITNNQVQVVTLSPSLAPEEVEQFITYPIELAMANIPGVVEVRSISRYGLSVVTMVFEESVRQLDARQLVTEQITIASESIPPSLGVPELMPITTGLGEIYQYYLQVAPGFEDRYDAMELRSIQDWIVKRQLSGIPGIVEVGSFGGYLKQYEVAVDPLMLQAFGLSIADVHEALSRSNQNTGGGYINRKERTLYIRAEGLLRSLEEIEQVPITMREGVPILVKQVATVGYGHALRYGAMTKDGQGEAVGGITLMLKGANSSATIKEVKKRVEKVQQSLPEGVSLVSYLDRSELVANTIRTVRTNLIEGGLIVIFVLVLLLGNWRAGLIVASVIPLSMLFAFGLMNVFGVSANLMSLGAIDFGIVVDGSVIVVESIVHYLHRQQVGKVLTKDEMNHSVLEASRHIRKSAAFGEIIILIVYLPILALAGIEGKMFHPMAQTVSFAILGAFILSLTYVPMMASLVLKRKIEEERGFSLKIITFLQRLYKPVLEVAIVHSRKVVAVALLLFGAALVGFLRLGGEFIPQLDEGDLAMQMTIPPGSSLDESIRTATHAERILLEQFPEVKTVVSKIGTAEIPTDPMAVEEADIMIILKDKDEWVSASSREELADKMKESLEVLSHASFDFTQPIQLRFNELISGVKTDIAVKIFGEDMEELYRQALKAGAIIGKIQGAGDIKVEQVEGMPQWTIRYMPDRLARYGLDVQQLNLLVRAAYAGERAGVIFEGERRFDLVVRLDSLHRSRLDIAQLMVPLPGGGLVALSQLAEIEEKEGPAQISRESTRRRVTIGINVRNRDVESLVEEIQARLDSQLKLKPGYFITYGGQFENLQHAKQRLAVAVPLALGLILALLYFTFHSLRYSLLIFTAVPLSAIGGVAALWLRDMPFSISAGIGFIALFGVAVLNGIVLITYFNRLRTLDSEASLEDTIRRGAMSRLRPVIMTAAVASLGFLPMALSGTAGAEVQRPLATVVIGGLITATFLTLMVLPALYKLINKPMKTNKALLTGILLFSAGWASAQTPMGMDDAVAHAIEKHPLMTNANLEVEASAVRQRTAWSLPGTEVMYQYGQQNTRVRDPYLEVNQSLGSPWVNSRQSRFFKELTRQSELQKQRTQAEIVWSVRSQYMEALYRQARAGLQGAQMANYQKVAELTDLRYRAGAISRLDRNLSQAELVNQQSMLTRLHTEALMARQELAKVIFSEEIEVAPADTMYFLLARRGHNSHEGGLWMQLALQEAEVAQSAVRTTQGGRYPEFAVGGYMQRISEPENVMRGLNGVMLTARMPLALNAQGARIQEAKLRQQMADNRVALTRQQLDRDRAQLLADLEAYLNQISAYEKEALPEISEVVDQAMKLYQQGEIDFFRLTQSLEQAWRVRMLYLDTLHACNMTYLQLVLLTT